MRLPTVQINPTSRWASLTHTLYLILLPVLVVVMVNAELVFAAFAIVVLSKWRMTAVKPRYWLANVRANMVDLIVGLSVTIFIVGSGDVRTWLVWAVLWVGWLLILKPRSDSASVFLQGLIAQGIGLTALYTNFSEMDQTFLILLTWLICFSSARHVLIVFEDSTNRSLTHAWAIFGAYMALILGRWQIMYLDFLPMIALVLSVIGYALAIGYYIHKTRGLRAGVKKQLIIFVVVILALIIVLSDWQVAPI